MMLNPQSNWFGSEAIASHERSAEFRGWKVGYPESVLVLVLPSRTNFSILEVETLLLYSISHIV